MVRIALLPACIAGHMSMIKPATWHDPEGKFVEQSEAITDYRRAGCIIDEEHTYDGGYIGCISQWYTNYTFIPGKRTIPKGSPLLTYPKGVKFMGAKTPWLAPGSAPVHSPCGVDGGNPDGCPAGAPGRDTCSGGGYGHGPDGRTLPGNKQPTEWAAGSVVETEFGITANHGGGYSFRLCPMPKSGNRMDLTEECFQQMPLRFHGNKQWIQRGANESSRVEITARRTDEGTFPKGSQWTKNPVPACGTPDGGGITGAVDGSICIGSQFKEPAPGVKGFFGATVWDTHFMKSHEKSPITNVRIVDALELPEDLPAGDYVLSFRIDCEQTAQIWSQCSDIRVVAPSVSV